MGKHIYLTNDEIEYLQSILLGMDGFDYSEGLGAYLTRTEEIEYEESRDLNLLYSMLNKIGRGINHES